MAKGKIRLYLASPYGFTDAGREFMKKTFITNFKQEAFDILNPWDYFDSISKTISEIYSLTDTKEQIDKLKNLNQQISSRNENLLEQAQVVVAILDGADVDSGVASEIGYACALGKKILGYRSDFRLTGDNIGAVVNIQVEYFINKSGGYIVRKISDLIQALEEV
jgi:nucleoside 2-deoxyribosyltransferase